MKTLILTGGTGSVGKAILEHQGYLIEQGINKIRVISRDEVKQVELARNYKGEIQLDCYLGDVTDRDRMRFALKDADFIIHAAAQKYIDKFESDIPVGYKTNITGSQNVADAFLESKNAQKAILVSTDKAADPITAYGISKLAAEHAWNWNNSFQKKIAYKIARFGNQWGSRGSVIETWTKAAKFKEPLKITDINCTRFFLKIEDAAWFILHSLFISPKTLNIPKMKSIEMIKVAEAIWKHWNPDSDFQYEVIGMRAIEKVHEILETNGRSSNETERFSEEEIKNMYALWLQQR